MSYINQYLSVFPKQFHSIMALEFALGKQEVENITKQAIEEKKKIITKTDPDKLDYIHYKLINRKAK